MSTVLTATNQTYVKQWLGSDAKASAGLSLVFFKLAAIPITILVLFLIYWLLPNTRVPWRRTVLPAVIVGLLMELLKYINLLTWPWLRVKVNNEYGPFGYSVVIILWSFFAAMLILAGGEWSARRNKIAAVRPTRIDSKQESLPNGRKEDPSADRTKEPHSA